MKASAVAGSLPCFSRHSRAAAGCFCQNVLPHMAGSFAQTLLLEGWKSKKYMIEDCCLHNAAFKPSDAAILFSKARAEARQPVEVVAMVHLPTSPQGSPTSHHRPPRQRCDADDDDVLPTATTMKVVMFVGFRW